MHPNGFGSITQCLAFTGVLSRQNRQAVSVSLCEWDYFLVQLKFMLDILKNNLLHVYNAQFYIISLELQTHISEGFLQYLYLDVTSHLNVKGLKQNS